MKSLQKVKVIDYIKEYEKEKEHCIQTFLTDDLFDKNKKQIINKYINFSESYCNMLRGLHQEEYQFTSSANQYLMRDFKKNINSIIEFNDVQLLQDLIDCFDVYYKQEYIDFFHLTSFLKACFECYAQLKFFIDSNIDESNYDKTINSLQKKASQLQKFSSKPIELDKIPYHPSDIILEFSSSLRVKKNDKLLFVNLILEAIKYNRFRGEYKTLPHPSQQTRNRIKENMKKWKPIYDAIILSWENLKK